MGFGARTVVASNVNLDSECMAFSSCAYVQKKTDVLNKYTMRAIVMVRQLVLDYYAFPANESQI